MLGIRNRTLGGWLLAGGVLAAVVGACADKKGAVMLAINTDMRAPKDVNAVSITISTNGAIKHSFIGRVTPQGEVLLPATLAIVEPDDASATIRIRVMAFQDRRPRVLRDIRTTVPTGGRTALLRIPLNFVNDGMVVGPNLPAGIVPDPAPGTGGETPPGGTSSGGANGGGTSGSGGTSGTSGTSGSTADGGTSGSGGTSGAVADAGTNAGSTSGDGSQFGTTAGDFDFNAAFQPPCNPPDGHLENQTIIDGECADNYVDPATLPDFDPGQIGDSTDVGSCFDLAKCFAGAVAIGDMTGTDMGGDGGIAAPKDAGATGTDATPDAAAPAVDSGAKPLPLPKDLRPSAVTLDRATCALQLNGASPDRLNLAIVTPDTGECVRPGECYVPIDHGDGGWKEQNGAVQLPSFVCKLLNGKNLSLATSSDVCAAKEEKNPICTPKVGEAIADSGTSSSQGDGGTLVDMTPVRIVPEDFATSVASVNNLLYFAGSTRVGQVNLADAAATASVVPGIPAAKMPWRFGTTANGAPPVGLANGSADGYVLSGVDGPASMVTIFAGTVDVTFSLSSAGSLAWGVNSLETPVYFSGTQGVATNLGLGGLPGVSAVVSWGGNPDALIVGDVNGGVRGCTVSTRTCAPQADVTGGGRVDALAIGFDNVHGYALTPNGVVRATLQNPASPGTPANVGFVTQLATATPPIDAAAGHYPRGLAVGPSCIFFTSPAGLHYTHDNGVSPSQAPVLVPAPATAPILGITVGPSPMTAGGGAVYYAVFAPGAQGGGVWRVPLPAECGGGGGPAFPDGGVGPADASGGGDGGSNCAMSCLSGCCTGGGGGACLPFPAQSAAACGQKGSACVDCGAGTCVSVPGGGTCG